jgi:hypothetical protein
MLFVYKQSVKPVMPWSMMRVGGLNNIAPQAQAKYLVLTNVEAMHRDGAWHYIFEFDTRQSLQMSPLAHLVNHHKEPAAPLTYKDGVNWKKWLGEDWQIIDEHTREEILRLAPVEPVADGVITGVRELPDWFPRSKAPLLAGGTNGVGLSAAMVTMGTNSSDNGHGAAARITITNMS